MSQPDPMQTRRDYASTPVRQAAQVPSTGGIELAHGIIIQSCNIACSTYRVQRVHRFLSAECDGSGSGSGSGT